MSSLRPGTRIQAITDFCGIDEDEINRRNHVVDPKVQMNLNEGLDGLTMPIVTEPWIARRIATTGKYVKGRKNGKVYALTSFAGIKYDDYKTISEYMQQHVFVGLCNQSSGQGEGIARQIGGTQKIQVENGTEISLGTWMYAVPNIEYLDPKSGKISHENYLALKKNSWKAGGEPVGRCNFAIVSQQVVDDIVAYWERNESFDREKSFYNMAVKLEKKIASSIVIQKELDDNHETKNPKVLLDRYFKNYNHLPYPNLKIELDNMKDVSDVGDMKGAKEFVLFPTDYRALFHAFRVGKTITHTFKETNLVSGGNHVEVTGVHIIVSLPGLE